MITLRVHPRAAEELEEAAVWYESERPGWGRLLHEEVRHKAVQAARLPKSGAPVDGAAPHHDVRAFGLARFPYRLVVALVGGERFIIAVAHTSREPRYWLDRVR